MKIYIAAPYQRKDDMNIYAAELRAAGVEVTSRWLDEPHRPTIQVHEVSAAENAKYAQQDIEDVQAADLVLFFTDPTKTIIRAGRHVEFGLALAYKKAILIVGTEHENVFHYLPHIRRMATWGEATVLLSVLRATTENVKQHLHGV